MTNAAILAAFEATWPAADYRDTGGFRVGRGIGGGSRVSSARPIGTWIPDDIDAASRVHAEWGQVPLFRVPDEDPDLAEILRMRGLSPKDPTALFSAPIAALTDRPVPRLTVFTVWPPMAIQREIWDEANIGAGRQAVMARVAGPRISLLGRINDRAAGAGFVAVHQQVAMMHALEIVPEQRRQGMAGWMIRQSAIWAAEQGASELALAVTRSNHGAIEMYRQMGFTEQGGYTYFG